MRKLFALVALSAALAYFSPPVAAAAEHYIGTIVVTDGGAVHNWYARDGGAFPIAGSMLLTVQPTAAAYVCVNEFKTYDAGLTYPDGGLLADGGAVGWGRLVLPFCSATTPRGVKVAADQALPTSCPSSTKIQVEDGGYVWGCAVSCLPVAGGAVDCPVYTRQTDGARPEW